MPILMNTSDHLASLIPAKPGHKGLSRIVSARRPYLTAVLLATALSLSLVAASAQAQTEAPAPDQSLSPDTTALSLTPIRPEIAAAPTQRESKKPGLARALAQNAPARPDINIKSLNQPQSINAGSITGQVTSMDGTRTVPGAAVVLTHNTQDHKRFETESDEKGNFHFNNIEPGGWTITTSAKEMLSHSQTTQVVAGETTNVPVKLDDIEPVDVLRITGKRSLIHPENITSRTNLDHRFVQEYRSGNDLRQLIESTPGVMNDSYGNVITRGEHNAVNYVIDDVIIPEAAGVLQQTQPISPRSLQSAQIDIGGYEAQDGGGPLGAVARLKTLPIVTKPNFTIGQQVGGPLAGSIYYNSSGAFSQNPTDKLNRLRFQSSGLFQGSSLRIAPPNKYFSGNGGADINAYARLEYQLTNRDLLKLSVSINQTFLDVPINRLSRQAGVRQSQRDRQNFFILSYKHKFEKLFDELNLHILNGFYGETFRSNNNFDPDPVLNADQPIVSIAARANRSNYIFSAQGDINKKVFKTHDVKAGFLTELRPVKTSFNATYYNPDISATATAQQDAATQIADLQAQAQALAETDPEGAQALLAQAQTINLNPFPYGAVLSPFSLQPQGPMMNSQVGKYTGFRYLQSAFLQDRWKPQKGQWKRLTLDNGVRFDLQHSVFGNALGIATQLAQTPGVAPFSIKPFETQRITSAQVSGRFGASIVLNKNTVLRGSFSQIFTPTPVDYFLTPIAITNSPVNGIYPGTPRPLQPTRGRMVDVSLEQQIGSRFATRTNIFYKHLRNFGDSGVIGNLPIYNRLTNSAQEAYGVETRMDLKPRRDGYGFNGFLSNTVQVAYLRGTHGVSGGFYDFPEAPLPKYPDHDRRYQGVVGLGYRSRQNWWVLADAQVMTGLQNQLDKFLVGQHSGRTPTLTLVSLSGGYQTPQELRKRHPWLPTSFDCRIENLLNQRLPTNLGSPFQGSRYTLPIRVLAGFNWTLGKDMTKLVSNPQTAKKAASI